MANETQKAQAVPVISGDEISRGHYSNSLVVSHTVEEFCIDWMLNAPNGIHMVSRVMVSPQHMKRIVGALIDNVKKYESTFGEIKVAMVAKGQTYQ